MYTGGLENHPRLLMRLSEQRRLWGNGHETVSRVRRPDFLAHMAELSGLPTPTVGPSGKAPAGSGQWLIKPLRGSGGVGVAFWNEGEGRATSSTYVQEFIEGEPISAVFLGAQLLGCTQQLIGTDFLRAAAFRYAGNVGPLTLPTG